MAAETQSGDRHVFYSSTEADVVLIAKDRVMIHVQSELLRQSSFSFRDKLQVCKEITSASTNAEIPVPESENLWIKLLDLINPAAEYVPEFTSLAEVTKLMRIAEKYKMKKAIALIRRLVMSDADLQKTNPIGLYALACRHGWEKEAKQVSGMTLDINMNTSDSLEKLRQIENGADLLGLLNLHRRRKESLDALLTNGHIFQKLSDLHHNTLCFLEKPSQETSTMSEHVKSMTRLHTLLAMDTCASGSELLTPEFWKNPKLENLFKCQNCNGRAFKKSDIIAVFRRILASFPATSEVHFKG